MHFCYVINYYTALSFPLYRWYSTSSLSLMQNDIGTLLYKPWRYREVVFELVRWMLYSPVLQEWTAMLHMQCMPCQNRDWSKLQGETWRPNYDMFSLQPIITQKNKKNALGGNHVNVSSTLITYNSESFRSSNYVLFQNHVFVLIQNGRVGEGIQQKKTDGKNSSIMNVKW
jgi:hypothetical protein